MGELRKIFRIEEMAGVALVEPPAEDNPAAMRHAQIMQELIALRAALSPAEPVQRELVGLHESRSQAAQITRIAHELEALMKGSEEATQKILAAAEDIDQAANNLSAALKGEIEQGLAQDIQDRVIHIFEACNFHDLTGQRVAKVMATLNRIERQIARTLDKLTHADAAPFMHGPRLESDPGHASQNEIDAMFSRSRSLRSA